MLLVKYSPRIKNKISSMLRNGLTLVDVADRVGVSRMTINRWIRKYPELKLAVDAARAEFEKEIVTSGLTRLAEGIDLKEEQTEHYEDRVIDNENVKVKVTKRTKYAKPDLKALAMLAAKHFKGEYVDNKEETKNINIKISQKDRALSLDERKKILYKDRAEGDDIVLDPNDYKELEESDDNSDS